MAPLRSGICFSIRSVQLKKAITDGMEGDLVNDPNSVFNGQRMVNGWKNSGLRGHYDVDPKRMVAAAAS